MTIEKLIEITGGICTNETSKNEVQSATVHLKKVSQNDLFISSNKDEIQEAIKLGASAILSDESLDYKSDVALIKVDSLEDSALKIISYMVNDDQDLYFYLLKPQAITFFKMIQLKKKDVEYIPDDWKKAFELILNSQKAIFVSSNQELLKKIKPKIKRFNKTAFGYNVEDTLFRSTFRIDKFVYQHKKMTPFHLEHLLKAVSLCDIHNLEYSIDRVKYTKHFMPIFIDEETFIQKGEISDHVVIIVDNFEDISQGREYAKTAKVTMSKSIVFAPPKVKIESYTKPTTFKDPVSLVTAVKTTSFNYGFVYSDKKEDLEALKAYFNQFQNKHTP
jgi:ferrochelatase